MHLLPFPGPDYLMTNSNLSQLRRHLRPSDLRGVAQLATQATVGVTTIVEGVHRSVWDTLQFPGSSEPGRTRGITGFVYRNIYGITDLVGRGVGAALTELEPYLEIDEDFEPATPQRVAILAALNGVMGDRLLLHDSPFAIPMTIRYQDRALNWQAMPAMPDAGGKVLLLIHGLCMNDLQWQTVRDLHVIDHAATLETTFGYTPVYLRYNSGLHVSLNGRELAAQLEQLIAHWPLPVEELTILAHSMGGLLARSAVYYAQEAGLAWPAYLRNLLFLGTPHHGAPLARGGHWVDAFLHATPYTAPFVRLGQLRSAGVTDLRYGHLLDSDWQGHDRFHRHPDSRQVVPLPSSVNAYAVAATNEAVSQPDRPSLIGDGLVPIPSALGQHTEAGHSLDLPEAHQWIAYRTNHMELLSSPLVNRKLVEWLA
jgi:pimeloyl-ACP methyl ester carboxylesterase